MRVKYENGIVLKKMKSDDWLMFDDRSGIANKDGTFYVFFDYDPHERHREGLGQIAGSGENPEEALIDAFIKTNVKMSDMAENIYDHFETQKFDPFQVWYGKPEDSDRTICSRKGQICFLKDDE